MRDLMEMENEIKARIASCDRRWPIEIWLDNSEKGYKERKVWIEGFYHNLYYDWHTIVDHPRRLNEIFNTEQFCQKGYPEKVTDVLIPKYGIDQLQVINDRLLVLQPYKYDVEDLKKLDAYCNSNFLKYERRWLSPYYIGTQLIIVYEDDKIVEEFVQSLLAIQDAEFGSEVDEDAKAEKLTMINKRMC